MGGPRTAVGVTAAALAALVLGGCGPSAGSPATPTVTTSVSTVTVPAATGAPTSSATPSAAAGGLTPPNCPTAQLAVSLGRADGAMGSVTRPLVFTNTGSSSCQLRGFPGVSWVAGDDGHQVGPAAVEDGARADQVDLGPGEAAHALVSVTDAQNYDPARCGTTDTRGLRVYPPGDTDAAYVPYPRQACTALVTLGVRTMQPGAS